eukprot:6700277-Prymnesium_polylepis.1
MGSEFINQSLLSRECKELEAVVDDANRRHAYHLKQIRILLEGEEVQRDAVLAESRHRWCERLEAAGARRELLESEAHRGTRGLWECYVETVQGRHEWKAYPETIRQELELGSQKGMERIAFQVDGTAYEALLDPNDSIWKQARVDGWYTCNDGAIIAGPCRRNNKVRRMRRCEVMPPNSGTVLYHQTSPANAAAILQSQRMVPGTNGKVGAGIYFVSSMELTHHKARSRGVVLKARVDLGKIHTVGQ